MSMQASSSSPIRCASASRSWRTAQTRSSRYPVASAHSRSSSRHGRPVTSVCTTSPSCCSIPTAITTVCGSGSRGLSSPDTSTRAHWSGSWLCAILRRPSRCAHPLIRLCASLRRDRTGKAKVMAETKEKETVGLTDIATRLPGLLMDAPAIVRGVMTGFMARPTAKTSIGKVFQERAASYADNVFIKFEDESLTYREANETVNRYAAVLAARGVGRGDVVGIMLKNSPRAVLLMLAVVKLGAIAGMLNYNQRGKVLAHSVGLLDSRVLVGEDELLEAVEESGADVSDAISVDELDRLAADAPTENPAVTSSVLAKDKAFYIFTSGTTGMPKARVMTHYR